MGNRLSKIYTRTGDTGTTGLGDGSRIDKDADRIEAIGDVDELNSCVGILCCELRPTDEVQVQLASELYEVQQNLFNLGGELAVPGYALIEDAQVTQLEQLLDQLNATLPALKDFILPGGNRAAAACHLVVCIPPCRETAGHPGTRQRYQAAMPELPEPFIRSALCGCASLSTTGWRPGSPVAASGGKSWEISQQRPDEALRERSYDQIPWHCTQMGSASVELKQLQQLVSQFKT